MTEYSCKPIEWEAFRRPAHMPPAIEIRARARLRDGRYVITRIGTNDEERVYNPRQLAVGILRAQRQILAILRADAAGEKLPS